MSVDDLDTLAQLETLLANRLELWRTIVRPVRDKNDALIGVRVVKRIYRGSVVWPPRWEDKND